MKTQILKAFVLSIAVLMAFSARAVTLTLSPSVTSNTYTGVITLTITGVANAEKVTVQRYIDLNANGLIDPGEPLVDAFKIADGGAMVVGGVTNNNVPYDSNPAGGAITATLFFNPALVIDSIVGQQIFNVITAEGTVTATLTVTNAVLGQSINGTVYSNGVVCPYAIVVAQDQAINSVAGSVVADASGNFSLALPPSSYTPITTVQNFYFDAGSAPTMTLSNGVSVTNNVFITNGTTTISGNIYDSSNSNGIGGLLVLLQSHNLFAVTFTDTNGNYSAAVAPNFWKIQPSKERLARRAYVVSTATFQVDATAGNVTNANISLFKGNALFYGRITTSSNGPLANVDVDSSVGGNVNTGYDAKGYSDPNGNYSVVALGDMTNQWSDQINSGKNVLLNSYIFNFFNTTALNPGQSVQENFVGLPVTATISGNVQDNSGTNVAGVTLFATATINGLNYSSLDATTDNSGNYSIGVASGAWAVQFLTGGFSDNLDAHGYEDIAAFHTVTIPPTNSVLNIIVYPLGTPFITSQQRYSASQFGFNVNGSTNVNYTVQYTTDLAAGGWQNLYSLTLTTNNFQFITDNNATNGARYYRVLKN